MKLFCPLGIAVALTCGLLQGQTAGPGMHTWTSTDGRKIEAAYVAMEGGSVKEVAAATKKHLLRERSYTQLSEEVKKGLRKEGIDVSFFPAGKNGPASSPK